MGFVYQSEIMKKYGADRKDFLRPSNIAVNVEPITVWRTFEDGHNHWEEGHIEGTSPKSDDNYQQKKWANKIWGKSFRYIVWYKPLFDPIFGGKNIGRIM